MKHQAFRPFAVMLSLLLVAGSTPVRASSIQFADVVQAIVDGQGGRTARVELRLRSVSQSGRLATSTGVTAQQGSADNNNTSSTETQSSVSSAGTVEFAQGPVTGQVETIDLGDVTGTVCDCGEIPVVKGGFPKWPFLALGAIPFLFIPRDDGGGGTIIPPCVDCNTPQIPEPATLLLFGSGLLALSAGARRRRAARRLNTVETSEEV